MRKRWNSEDLDEYVAEIDALGGISSPESREATRGFALRLKTEVDVRLDPFSDAYFEQQKRVYEDISGREIDQETGEIMPFDLEPLIGSSNPYGSENIDLISKHCRTVLTALMVANPPPGARVLDMGAGWGLSSEMMAYAGAQVTAVDINPGFVDLIMRRAERTGLPIKAIEGNFDTVEPGSDFDVVLFYECLHHALRPYDTLRRVARFLNQNSRIVLAGEPINSIWWPSWGMRLDAESVYVMRKFGWFESGWSEQFISECLRRAGFEPIMIRGIGINGGDICVADRAGSTNPRPLSVPPEALGRTSTAGAADPTQVQVTATEMEVPHVASKRRHWKFFKDWKRSRRN